MIFNIDPLAHLEFTSSGDDFIISGTCFSLFKINAENGEIKTTDVIDRDTGDIKDASGVCSLTVMVNFFNTTL